MSMRVPTPYSLPSPRAWKGSWSTVWNHTLQSMSKLLCTYKKNCLMPFPAYLSSSISHSLGTHVCTYTHTSPHYHAVFCLYASCTSARNSFFPKNLFKTQLRYHVLSKISLSLFLQERWVRLKGIAQLQKTYYAPSKRSLPLLHRCLFWAEFLPKPHNVSHVSIIVTALWIHRNLLTQSLSVCWGQWFSKCGLWTSSSRITQELIDNENSQTSP